MRRSIVLPMLALLSLGFAVHGWILSARTDPAPPAPAPSGWLETRTPHYLIVSNAPAEQVARTGVAVEHLHDAFVALFPHMPSAHAAHPRLRLVLYRTRAEFKANNRGIPWAEALYRRPECHAYVADGPNPYHWMVHEAAHQLSREVMDFRRVRWIDEGLASYLGSSRIDEKGLHAGTLDPNAYPLWWLPQFQFTGNLEVDAREGRIIPLRALIEDTGPPIASYVNLYYIEFWSLTHFLLHHDGGRHAAGFKRLLATDATLADFEREIGPVWMIQVEWYDYLRKLRTQFIAENAAVSAVQTP